MNLIDFEKLVQDYIKTKDEYIFIEILNSLKGYIISVASNTRLKHYEYSDIVQELEFSVFKALDKYNIESHKAWGYLTTCIKNKMYALYSSNLKLIELETKLIKDSNLSNSSSNISIDILIEYKTNDLTAIETEILDLYYNLDYSISEIARKMQKSNSYITKKKRSALKKINGCSL